MVRTKISAFDRHMGYLFSLVAAPPRYCEVCKKEIVKSFQPHAMPYNRRVICNDKVCAGKRKMQLLVASGRWKPRTIHCATCGTGFIAKKGKPTNYCEACRRTPERKNERMMMREYQTLLRNSEKLNVSGFIKLQALAEFFGRDLEEWVNESEHLRELSQRLARDQALFDESERRKKSKEPEKHDSEIVSLSDFCSCPACARLRKQRLEQNLPP